MKYRKYGRFDFHVSEIGMGGHREGFDTRPGLQRQARFFLHPDKRAEAVGAAIDAGVNYFDTTYGCEIRSLGESLRLLKADRDALFVSGMRVDFFANLKHDEASPAVYARREVESRIQEFGFDRIDQFVLGAAEFGDPLAPESSDVVEETLGELDRLRAEGKIRSIAFSTHDPDFGARMLEKHPVFDAVMTPYNYENRVAEGALARALFKTGAAWITMKNLVWQVYGIPMTCLRNLGPEIGGRLGLNVNAPIARLALQYVLQNPKAVTTAPAMNSLDAVAENVAASEAPPLVEEDFKQLDAYAAAARMRDSVVLGIAGLLEDNLRVRGHAIGFLCRKLGIEDADVDFEADDALEQAASAATRILARMRADAEWAEFVPADV